VWIDIACCRRALAGTRLSTCSSASTRLSALATPSWQKEARLCLASPPRLPTCSSLLSLSMYALSSRLLCDGCTFGIPSCHFVGLPSQHTVMQASARWGELAKCVAVLGAMACTPAACPSLPWICLCLKSTTCSPVFGNDALSFCGAFACWYRSPSPVDPLRFAASLYIAHTPPAGSCTVACASLAITTASPMMAILFLVCIGFCILASRLLGHQPTNDCNSVRACGVHIASPSSKLPPLPYLVPCCYHSSCPRHAEVS
jgi:hypothetical protein